MLSYLKNWYREKFSDPRAINLAVVLLLAAALGLVMAQFLKPVLASIVIAYLLEGLAGRLESRDISRRVSVGIVYSVFIVFSAIVLTALLPLLTAQAADLVRELPDMLPRIQGKLLNLSELYPAVFSPEQIREMLTQAGAEIGKAGQQLLSSSVALLPGLIAVVVYLILVPLLVFFFLKDKKLIAEWLKEFLPDERSLAKEVWAEVDVQIGNYVRGKFVEITIVGTCAYALFMILGLNYAALLGLIVGLSVLIPYIGATLVTFPVALVAYFQFGVSGDFGAVLIGYLILQALDGNVLVPLLFSEVVALHPVAIIVAVLFFGAIWGFWGVFFAIPLATVIKAVLSAWPETDEDAAEASQSE